MSQFEVEPSQNLMHMPRRDHTSIDVFLSHVKDPRVPEVPKFLDRKALEKQNHFSNKKSRNIKTFPNTLLKVQVF